MGHSGPDGKCKGVIVEARECQPIRTVAMQQESIREQAAVQHSASSASTAGDAWPQTTAAAVLQHTSNHESTASIERSSSRRRTATTTFNVTQTAPMSDEVRARVPVSISWRPCCRRMPTGISNDVMQMNTATLCHICHPRQISSAVAKMFCCSAFAAFQAAAAAALKQRQSPSYQPFKLVCMCHAQIGL